MNDPQAQCEASAQQLDNSRRGSLDVGKALKLRMTGLTYEEIGERLGGFDKSSVCRALHQFTALLEHPESVKTYRENEADLLDAVRMKLITSLPNDLAVQKGKGKLSGYQKVGMYGILFDKTRLLRDQSTENVSNLTRIIQEVHRGIEAEHKAVDK